MSITGTGEEGVAEGGAGMGAVGDTEGEETGEMAYDVSESSDLVGAMLISMMSNARIYDDCFRMC